MTSLPQALFSSCVCGSLRAFASADSQRIAPQGYTSDAEKTERFYTHDLGAYKAADPQNPRGVRYYFNRVQFVEVLPLSSNSASNNRFDHLSFNTADAEQMRHYLASKSIDVPAKVNHGSDGSQHFEVQDPEGNRVQFVQPPLHPPAVPQNALSHHMIQVGCIVHNGANDDALHHDILGFRPY